MRTLFTIDLKDYDESWKRSRRPSVRAIIVREGRLALVHSLKFDYYKFPGGGIEDNETHSKALIREVLEETGLTVIPESIKEYGSVLRIQKSAIAENTIFEQENFYYLCGTGSSVTAQKLDDYEDDEGFTLEFVSPGHAIDVNRTRFHGEGKDEMIERETRVMELLLSDMSI